MNGLNRYTYQLIDSFKMLIFSLNACPLRTVLRESYFPFSSNIYYVIEMENYIYLFFSFFWCSLCFFHYNWPFLFILPSVFFAILSLISTLFYLPYFPSSFHCLILFAKIFPAACLISMHCAPPNITSEWATPACSFFWLTRPTYPFANIYSRSFTLPHFLLPGRKKKIMLFLFYIVVFLHHFFLLKTADIGTVVASKPNNKQDKLDTLRQVKGKRNTNNPISNKLNCWWL